MRQVGEGLEGLHLRLGHPAHDIEAVCPREAGESALRTALEDDGGPEVQAGDGSALQSRLERIWVGWGGWGGLMWAQRVWGEAEGWG